MRTQAAYRENSLKAALLAAALCVAGALLPLAGQAQENCGAVGADGIAHCSAGLEAAHIDRMQTQQEAPDWCWAASIAMVFAHHGRALPQRQIVVRHFVPGAPLPETPLPERAAVTAAAITQLLAAPWHDSAGRPFRAQAQVGDAPGRSFHFNNDTVIRELAAQRPLIVGALGHAMVLVRVHYERFVAQGALRITGATVIDPLPGAGVRRLAPRELRPSYVAAVQLLDDDASAAAAE